MFRFNAGKAELTSTPKDKKAKFGKYRAIFAVSIENKCKVCYFNLTAKPYGKAKNITGGFLQWQ